jgi:transposase
MKALSLDLRQRVADALDSGASHPSIAQRFAVSLSSVERLARKKRENQSLHPGVGAGRKPKVDLADQEQREAFAQLAASRTDWTLQTLADAWQEHEQGGKALSAATVLRTLRRLKFSFEKRAASQRKETRPSVKTSGSR